MLKLRDFKCACGREFEDLVGSGELTTGCECGGTAHYTIRKIAVHGADSFNPYYCEQVGQWFESADHKKKVLKAIGREQISGKDSPRNTVKTSMKMTLDQAKKFDPMLEARMPKV